MDYQEVATASFLPIIDNLIRVEDGVIEELEVPRFIEVS